MPALRRADGLRVDWLRGVRNGKDRNRWAVLEALAGWDVDLEDEEGGIEGAL